MEKPKAIAVGQRWQWAHSPKVPPFTVTETYGSGATVKYDDARTSVYAMGDILRDATPVPTPPSVESEPPRGELTMVTIDETVDFDDETMRKVDAIMRAPTQPAIESPPPVDDLAIHCRHGWIKNCDEGSCRVETRDYAGPTSALEAIRSRPKPEPWVESCDPLHWIPDA